MRSVPPQCGQTGPLGHTRASTQAIAVASSWRALPLRMDLDMTPLSPLCFKGIGVEWVCQVQYSLGVGYCPTLGSSVLISGNGVLIRFPDAVASAASGAQDRLKRGGRGARSGLGSSILQIRRARIF